MEDGAAGLAPSQIMADPWACAWLTHRARLSAVAGIQPRATAPLKNPTGMLGSMASPLRLVFARPADGGSRPMGIRRDRDVVSSPRGSR